MQHVVAAVAAALSITPAVAARIVEENAETLHGRAIPDRVEAMGYATANGSHLMLASTDRAVICDLRISVGALAAIEEERGVVETPAETPLVRAVVAKADETRADSIA